MSDTLFDMNEYRYNEHGICKECINLYRLKYDSGKIFNYCKVTMDNKTHNKMKKVLLKDRACNQFKG